MGNHLCLDCGKALVGNAKRCGECKKANKRAYAKERHKKFGRHHKNGICSICKKPMKIWREKQIAHSKCRYKPNDYAILLKEGNPYAVKKLVLSWGVIIPKYWVIHHIDENPKNNTPENLWIMHISAHNSLHRRIQVQWSLWLKNHSSNDENCWNIVRDHITTAWLETTTAKVIKICDIRQSAAELLSSKKE